MPPPLDSRLPLHFRTAARALAGTLALALGLHPGCAQKDYNWSSEGVYVRGEDPLLARAGAHVSEARREATREAAITANASARPIDLVEAEGFGPEEFQITVGPERIRVEGGGPGGVLYGSLEMARKLREGSAERDLGTPRTSPVLADRLVRTRYGPPGAAPTVSVDWPGLLDALSGGRWNGVVVECGHSFPFLVRLSRFPKAFESFEQVAARRSEEFQQFLTAAQERGVRVILCVRDLSVPESLLRFYGGVRDDASTIASLSRTYLRECFAELLRAYPSLWGLGISPEALPALSPRGKLDFVNDVFIEAIRTSGRTVALYVPAELTPLLGPMARTELAQVFWEVEAPATGAPRSATGGVVSAPAVSAPSLQGGRTVCAWLRRQEWSAGWLSPATCKAFLDGSAALGARAAVIDWLGDASASRSIQYAFERETYNLLALGLASFSPAPTPGAQATTLRAVSGVLSDSLPRALDDVSAAWRAVASLRLGRGAWSPFQLEEPGAGHGLDWSDGKPFISLLEWTFAHSRGAGALSVAESVAFELTRKELPESRRAAATIAQEALERTESALSALEEARASSPVLANPIADSLLRELEGTARLLRYHARRTLACVELLRHVSGIEPAARERGLAALEAALEEWGKAQEILAALRNDPAGDPALPDLVALREAAWGDLRIARDLSPDPEGFSTSPLVQPGGSMPAAFEFSSMAEYLDLGLPGFGAEAQALGDETRFFECEDLLGGWRRETDHEGSSGLAYVSSGPPGALFKRPLTLRLRTETPGPVAIWVRFWRRGERSATPALLLNARALLASEAEAQGTASPSFRWVAYEPLETTPGLQVIQVLPRVEGQEDVDAIVVAHNRSWRPPRF